ncbi:TRAP transporter small permease [Paracoccus aeridis]|uniref:TRAP transporter small permease n=1 Tax=Paracoccus aeridis TaxID=1966466 RepID=UPI00191C09F9|nr:TRAP transporter small permease [Paracoccus aeridis]
MTPPRAVRGCRAPPVFKNEAVMWKIYDRILEILAILFLAGTVLAVFVGALMRAIGHPVAEAPEIAQLLLIWTVVLGAALVMQRGDHIRITALPDALSPAARRVLHLVLVSMMLAFLAYLGWIGGVLAGSNWAREMGVSGLSYGWVTLALPVGCVLMIVSLLRRLFGLGLLFSIAPEVADQEYPL